LLPVALLSVCVTITRYCVVPALPIGALYVARLAALPAILRHAPLVPLRRCHWNERVLRGTVLTVTRKGVVRFLLAVARTLLLEVEVMVGVTALITGGVACTDAAAPLPTAFTARTLNV